MDNLFPDIEVEKLKKKVKELETKVGQYEQTLKDHGLLEQLSQKSDLIVVCEQQLAKFRDLSDKGLPFILEDSKNFDIIAKIYLAAIGKAPAEEKKGKKKEEAVDIGKLLKIVEGKE